MTSNNRRVFLMQVVAAGSVLAAAGQARAAMLDEKDAQAVALGYVADTMKADGKKFAKHTNDQKCNSCGLYQGKAGDAAGGCPLFGTKQVASGGWCSAWVKKA